MIFDVICTKKFFLLLINPFILKNVRVILINTNIYLFLRSNIEKLNGNQEKENNERQLSSTLIAKSLDDVKNQSQGSEILTNVRTALTLRSGKIVGNRMPQYVRYVIL